LGVLLSLGTGCESPECANNDFSVAECRVLGEWELAHLALSSGEALRFTDPALGDAALRDARGRLRETLAGVISARVAGAGDFSISVVPEFPSTTVEVQLENVSPYATLFVGEPGQESALPPDGDGDLRRVVTVDTSSGRPQWIRGEVACPESYRIAFLGDIQTNPLQFERIVESINASELVSSPTAPPVMALAIVGDLTESSTADQFELIHEIANRSSIPVITTPGNHDVYQWDVANYLQTFGPGNHVSELCSTRLVMLDTGNAQIARSVQGRLPALLEHPEHEHLVLGMHHPPFPKFTGAGWTREDQAQALLVEAAIADADLIVAGHYHALRDFEVPVGDQRLRQIIAGTGGADQGLGIPRYGYLRVELGPGKVEACFVEVPPLGSSGPLHEPGDSPLPYCE
jgi:3',5'-cyclic AMP phosphodiesterase CpdA